MNMLPIITSFFLSFIITPFIAKLAKYFGLVDDPKKRSHPAHTHKGIVPRGGGLALFIGFVISILIFIKPTKLIIAIIIAIALLMIVGLIDDKNDVDPYLRLFTNSLAALIIIGAGAGIPFITNPITSGVIRLDTFKITFDLFGQHSILVWADIFAFIWIMWVVNIVGWSAGIDGQMPGFVAISAIFLGILSFRFSAHDLNQTIVTTLAFITAGTFLGFLPWNFYPQKIMPGYGGKTLAGFLLALLGILSYAKLGTALLVLGIPTVDAVYTLLRRMSKGKSPVWADRGHFHHKLLDIGWGRRRIALFYWATSAILGVIALFITSQQKVFTFLLLIVGIGGFFVWINFLKRFPRQI